MTLFFRKFGVYGLIWHLQSMAKQRPQQPSKVFMDHLIKFFHSGGLLANIDDLLGGQIKVQTKASSAFELGSARAQGGKVQV